MLCGEFYLGYHKIEGNQRVQISFQRFVDILYKTPLTIIDENLAELTTDNENFAIEVIRPSLITGYPRKHLINMEILFLYRE